MRKATNTALLPPRSGVTDGVAEANVPSFASSDLLQLFHWCLMPIVCFDALVAGILIICRQVRVN